MVIVGGHCLQRTDFHFITKHSEVRLLLEEYLLFAVYKLQLRSVLLAGECVVF